MESYIHYEFLLLIQSLYTGAALLLIYSCLLVLRRLFSHSRGWVMAEDLIYWLFTGCFLAARLYDKNQGIPRLFLAAGLLLGAFSAKKLVEPVFISLGVKILEYPVKIVKILIKRLLFLAERCKISVCEFAKRWGKCPLRKAFHPHAKKNAKRSWQFGRVRQKETKKENRV
nr:spore cortex biosynthesis protein YabQ [uncultured Blautia sp.]